MSLFCSSCHKLYRNAQTLTRQLFSSWHLNGRTGTPPRPQFQFRHLVTTKKLNLNYSRYSFIQFEQRRRHFSSSKNLQSGQDPKDEGLTEEEKKLLAELEEEERLIREIKELEELDGEKNNDYSIWNPEEERGGGGGEARGLSESVAEGHRTFENRQRIIQDVIDEMWNPLPEPEFEPEPERIYPRGKTGVIDLPDLCRLLKAEGAQELVAIALPKEIDYADYMVIVTVMNNRQLLALATFVRKRMKQTERKKTDNLPWLDKKMNHHGWIALDMGNIILQIFLQETRDFYDLEMLWTVGPKYDDLFNLKDPEIVQLLNYIEMTNPVPVPGLNPQPTPPRTSESTPIPIFPSNTSSTSSSTS